MGDENVDVIPGSRRPDGTLRKPVRVKKGYVPPEEQDKFRPVDTTPAGVVGADADAEAKAKAASATARKNEKRKEKKKAAESGNSIAADGDAEPVSASAEAAAVPAPAAAPAAAPSADKSGEPSAVEKKIKGLQKKLRQIDELEEKKANGATLNAEQTAKIAAREDIEAEVAKWESLGEMDVGKKVKGLKKKLRQIEELEEKKASGVELNADQQGKVNAKEDLLDEIKTLEALAIS